VSLKVATSTNLPLISAQASKDSFGCPFDKLYKNQSLSGGNISFFRKGAGDLRLEQVTTPPSDRGFLIGVSTLGGHRRRIFHEHHATHHDFEENSLYIRDLAESYRADLGGPFDFLLLEISPSSLARIVDEADMSGVTRLACADAARDPVLGGLVRALIPALERPEAASTLFIDQMATAIGTYLVHQYGDLRTEVTAPRRTLSRAHESLAKSMLRDNFDGDISISEVAGACNLSRGYFIRAFRETTGQTPYQWLLGERVRHACELLRQPDLSLAEVAISCGFGDQSHFTRAFANIVGATPGNWRRTALF
jgi:AraC-like DNA-binding protein